MVVLLISRKISSFVRCTVFFALCSLVPPHAFSGNPPVVSQMIATRGTVLDEAGRPLSGNGVASVDFGIPHVVGDLVQILACDDGIIYPPALDGSPDPRNPVVYESNIGLGVSPGIANPGRFASPVSPRPQSGRKIFARVFNSSTLSEASFYADSDFFIISSSKNETFWLDVTRTDQPIDDRDEDGDGVINSWEVSIGTDRRNADSDSDGLSDGDERITKTDALDSSSVLLISDVRWGGADDAVVSWDSVEGVRYRVEASDGGHGDRYKLLATVVATSRVAQLLVEDGLMIPTRCYRVVAIQ